MKSHLINCLFVVLFVFTKTSYANEFFVEYDVKTSGIKIGKFEWSLKINGKNYKTEIYLKNSGMLSSLYKFYGEYESIGIIKNNKFKTLQYKQYWKTKKKTKVVEMSFNEYLTMLSQTPKEKEFPRINLETLYQHFDPLTSFINILNGNETAKTIDGRRIYTMKRVGLEKSQQVTLEITNYKNIWADHKRNDLHKIEFFISEKNIIPEKINIFFKDRIFKLKKR